MKKTAAAVILVLTLVVACSFLSCSTAPTSSADQADSPALVAEAPPELIQEIASYEIYVDILENGEVSVTETIEIAIREL